MKHQVDVSNPEGIKRAVSRNLGSSGLADVISSSFLFETTALFQSLPESGRCFTMLKHPVARAISLYHRFQKNDEMHAKPAQYQGFTIEEFAKAQTENNWMVRFLTGKRSGALSFNDLEVAKQGMLILSKVNPSDVPRVFRSHLTMKTCFQFLEENALSACQMKLSSPFYDLITFSNGPRGHQILRK